MRRTAFLTSVWPGEIRSAFNEMGLGELAGSLDSRFKATVSVLYTVLCPISELSQTLQSPELNLLGAQDHLQLLLSQMTALRTNDEYVNCIRRSTESENVLSGLALNSAALEIPVAYCLHSVSVANELTSVASWWCRPSQCIHRRQDAKHLWTLLSSLL